MSKILVIAGHGLQPNGRVDPGASGNGTNESEFLREKFVPAMKKFAPGNMDFHTKNNFFAHRLADNLTGYVDVIELHLDWAPRASGGHVIVHKTRSADKVDKAIRDVINNFVGLRGANGLSFRSDLNNLNVFARRNIPYRLVELGFINNADDMQKIRDNINDYAEAMVKAITGGEVEIAEQVSKPTPTPSKPKQVTGKVADIQRKLNAMGFNIAVDNIMGPETKRALVRALQTELNKQTNARLTVDGLFGRKTREACINVRQGARGNITWILQAILHCRGFVPGAIDGIFGVRTRNAVRNFQSVNKLVADGIAGPQTFQMLFK